MNERIKELAKRATKEIWGNNQYNGAPEFEGYELDQEKFAELIINECISLCEETAINADLVAKGQFVTETGRILHEGMWGGSMNCIGSIKNHFGVK